MCVCGVAIARKGMARDILRETPAEKVEICSWMYISKDLSDFQRPIFLMVRMLQPARCMAMAPPARSEWLLTSEGV